MPTLETTYMGIPLKSPLVVAASSLSNMIDRVQRAEASGAGALVIRSLFEEQIKAEQAAYASGRHTLNTTHLQEAKVYFPSLSEDAAQAHLMWVKKTRDAVKMPLIASLNAATVGTWTQYARELERTGVNALELNIYSVAADPAKSGAEIEAELFSIVESVLAEVSIPVSVKLGPFYTSVAHIAAQLAQRGVQGLVLFNRFLQPDIRLDDMSLHNEIHYSTREEIRLPLRWTAILYGRIPADIALTTGVHMGEDAIKAILAGAQVVQLASILYQRGFEHLQKIQYDMLRWMQHNGKNTLADFRGKLSQQKCQDPQIFERAQYVKLMIGEG